MGQQALREREQLQSKLPVEPQLHPFENEFEEKPLFAAAGVAAPVFAEPVAPMVIEAPVIDVPRSERVVKERQKPLFNELPDSKLPQVDLLDSLTQRQEGVAPETLEMTSRMIEKRLKDFGVEVRVVAAMPGPVITRYEIEPATGVKGSQVVNLAKDLARSLSLISIRVVETIPGKNYMALELPNAKRQSIKLSEILGSQVYNEAKSMLTMGLGKDIVGQPRGGRPGQDAARVGGRYHGFGQVSRYQRHDFVFALQSRSARCSIAHDRSQDARDVGL